MRKYLLDTNILGAYLQGRPGAVELVRIWITNDEAATSIVIYGELAEYLKQFPNVSERLGALRTLLNKVHPYPLTYHILEQYAEIRRTMRPPHGPGLIGDIDTLIAATAIDTGLTLVTTDGDFTRVPGLAVILVNRNSLKNKL